MTRSIIIVALTSLGLSTASHASEHVLPSGESDATYLTTSTNTIFCTSVTAMQQIAIAGIENGWEGIEQIFDHLAMQVDERGAPVCTLVLGKTILYQVYDEYQRINDPRQDPFDPTDDEYVVRVKDIEHGRAGYIFMDSPPERYKFKLMTP